MKIIKSLDTTRLTDPAAWQKRVFQQEYDAGVTYKRDGGRTTLASALLVGIVDSFVFDPLYASAQLIHSYFSDKRMTHVPVLDTICTRLDQLRSTIEEKYIHAQSLHETYGNTSGFQKAVEDWQLLRVR